MRGIPGSGKSTKAKSLVGNGKIHSTDDLIDAAGDYKEFFAKMVADQVAKKSDAFAPLHNMHVKNLSNAIESMKAGESPVIIDNTNIKHADAKAYVKAALELGFADDNIKFVDIGTAGLDAEKLAARNQHGVPLDKIKQMIDTHTLQGPMTLKSVLDAKDMYKPKVLYSAVVLDEKSRKRLLDALGDRIPEGWEVIAHHMTITFGKELPEDLKYMLGKTVELKTTKMGISDMAFAVLVDGFKTLTGKPAHITIAVNRKEGGKPVMSGDIKKWVRIYPFNLTGVVTEITK